MREILFRGKTAKGEWVYGNYEYYHKPEKHIISDIYDKITKGVSPETVGQFTGLTDKNGKKIFEGDIVKFHTETYTEEYDTIGAIEYSYGAFGIAYANRRHFLEFCTMSMYIRWYEVIDNIHDNPDLLKEQQNERKANY